MNISLRDMGYFEVAAQTGSLARAAERCHVTQPALSKSIARIEQVLDQQLFLRTRRGMTLTSSGEMFLTYVRRIRKEYDEAMRYAADLRSGHGGLLRIGATRPVFDSLLSNAVIQMVRIAPGVRMELELCAADDQLAWLAEGRLDMALAPLKSHMATDFEVQSLGVDSLAVIARCGHPAFARPDHPLRDLLQYGWILPKKNSAALQWFNACFNRAGLAPPAPAIEVDYAGQSTLEIAAATDYLMFVPGSWNARLPRALGRLQVPDLDSHRAIHLATRRDGYWSSAMWRMRDILLELSATMKPF